MEKQNSKNAIHRATIPNLRFPEFEGEWISNKMSDIYSFKVTNSFSRENLNYENGDVKNIHYGDIHKKFQTLLNITKENIPFINSDISIERINEDNYCKEGDLILADASEDINDVGKSIELIFLNNERLLSGLHTILARPNLDKISIGFGGYLFTSNKIRTQIQKESQGTKVLSISVTRLTKISLTIPSKKEEQQKIADFFTAIDEKLQALKKKKTLLEAYKKGIMQKLFSQKLRFKDADGKDFPDWEEKKLGELTFKVGKKNKDNINYPIYSINNQEGFRPQSEQFEGLDSNDRGYDISLYKIVNEKTFAYNPARINVGSIGYSYNLNNVIISSLYVCFKTTKELDDLYLLAYLDTPKFNTDILRYEEGGVRQYLFYENFSQIPIPLPSIAEQSKIANFLSSIDEKIKSLDAQIEKTETWKKGLLQKMFV